MVLSPADLDEVARVGSMWDGRVVDVGHRDRTLVNEAISRCYRSAGLEPPREKVWCEGPLDLATLLSDTVYTNDQLGPSVRQMMVDEARDAASVEVQRHVDAVDRSRIQSRLGLVATEALRRSIAGEVLAGMRREIAAQSARRLGWRRLLPWVRRPRPIRDLAEISVSRYSSSWLAIYQVLGEVSGLVGETSRLSSLWEAVLGAGWIMPYQHACWIMAAPSAVHVDTHNRLHSPSGPALCFPDGWKLYAWKGTAVPADFIENRATIDGDAIARQADPVLRRCMLEIMTPERFIREGEATCVATDECGRLWRRRWPNGDVWAAVEVLNGTPEPDGSIKHYYLQVPPGVRSAREAVAWTYGLTELRYMALKQRT